MRLRFALLACVGMMITTIHASLTTYKEMLEPSASGDINTNDVLTNVSLAAGSTTTFLYITLWPDRDHTAMLTAFDSFVSLYAAKGAAMIPRVRYHLDAPFASADTVKADLEVWAPKLAEASKTIHIPVVQAGFLGMWGEWHSWPIAETVPANLDLKRHIVTRLQAVTGLKIALRYVVDHRDLFGGGSNGGNGSTTTAPSTLDTSSINRTVTLHDDCIFAGGATGSDGGSFPDDVEKTGLTREQWRAYAVAVADGGANWAGGEGCDNVKGEVAAVDWTNVASLCDATTGLAAYIKQMGIAYMNVDFPTGFTKLMTGQLGATAETCRQGILTALG